MSKEFSDIKKEVLAMNLDEESGLTFKAACVILYALNNDTWNMKRIHWATGYTHTEVKTICGNLRKQGILTDHDSFNMEGGEDEWMEFILICMAAAGELVRLEVNGEKDKYNIQKAKPHVKTIAEYSPEEQEGFKQSAIRRRGWKIKRLAKKINKYLQFYEQDILPYPEIEEEVLQIDEPEPEPIPEIKTEPINKPYQFYVHPEFR